VSRQFIPIYTTVVNRSVVMAPIHADFIVPEHQSIMPQINMIPHPVALSYPIHKTQLLKIHHSGRFWHSQMHTKQF